MESEDDRKRVTDEKDKTGFTEEETGMARIILIGLIGIVVVVAILFVFVFGKISVAPSGI